MASSALLDIVTGFGARDDRIVHVRDVPQRFEHESDWPEWIDEELKHACHAIGVDALWDHQLEAAQSARDGSDVVIATPTASGKSLGFWLPVLESIQSTRTKLRTSSAIYIAPTKALAADQMANLEKLIVQGMRPATYDGDTSQASKDWARRHANIVFTNPDMLHRGILPQHERFSRLFKSLRFIVIDEAHRYRGVFGSHVALILRRLLRIAAHYGAHPVVIGASATMANPDEAFAKLTGRDVHAVSEDSSPRASGSFALWEPPVSPGGERRSGLVEAADILTDAMCAGYRSIGFIASRRGTEALASTVRDQVGQVDDSLKDKVAAYRGGYLAEERRLLESALRSGRLLAVASTNALELGIDISGLDLVIISGWPGTLASLWQQAGRAGRAGQRWMAVFIARDDPLDTYVVNHPEVIFDAPVDAGVIHPGNPHVLGGHLCAAAAEVPLKESDLVHFPDNSAEVLADLVDRKLLRARPTGWFWAKDEPAADMSDIRGSGGGQFRLVEASTGALLGTVDESGAFTGAHPGAVYTHQGADFTVLDLDLEDHVALVERAEVDYTTQARSQTEIDIVDTDRQRALASGVTVCSGTVDVKDHVIAYRMRAKRGGAIIAEHELDLPERTLQTKAVWWTIPQTLLDEAEIVAADLPGAVHAAEHASIGLLPLFAGCDRWDIGGVSTAGHADTGMATVFVYDGLAGGAGFAERGYDVIEEWLAATRDAISACECVDGCPSCVQSPKCGNGNEPLEKDAALRLLRAVLV
ncbi:MAG: DEAD/DEAH box helicase [Brevibacterium sp.]|uniref:DEAD/DEAH box helicase n=1 Tax=Brevibacterium sp. TaxID=1701 RepID=UPI0026475E87|nr:DEAD/DEAH box helicase [Brevibacterium sp.]MDN5806280.1 DEAD/DEAH box helicase [Brevibacterium sp.]MDN5832905.1 DEAD/DEAH box helicase [Brevibacterium sp.]MDN5876072.1 DEAD/DEAH box helicase [Brevibacterium sp.]MDN5908890.1 DEAD/DEAH box helicase [Brevibacterium sp.]MDN6132763.1 DEAD/DEAH box helicase [Brevibacterium sp.]